MSMSNKIRTILTQRNMTIKDLSDSLGYKGSNLYNKLKKDDFTESECRKIAEVLNCDYDGIFIMRDSKTQI
ncbi:MAG: helix-turn-helix transcriptional regulator [Clostridiales bacterium]|jgi:DNA-binding Xre family transcriptional regulator|nr:helix-turn-helix transcriptional regulator [Clostridiales bacterium]